MTASTNSNKQWQSTVQSTVKEQGYDPEKSKGMTPQSLSPQSLSPWRNKLAQQVKEAQNTPPLGEKAQNTPPLGETQAAISPSRHQQSH
ncbi:hypothetical protein AB6D20_027730 (plasmid) [Vibrio splendidus]